LKQYLYLCDKLDKLKTNKNKIDFFLNWTRSQFESNCALLLFFEATNTGKVRGLLQSNDSTVEVSLTLKNKPISSTILLKDDIRIESEREVPLDGTISFAYIPVNSHSENPIGALLIGSKDPEDLLKVNALELKLLSLKLRDIISRETNTKKYDDNLKALILLGDNFELPIYITDIEGHFLFASKSFLSLTGYSNLIELNSSRGLFKDSRKRKEEIETIIRKGFVRNYPLVLTSLDGSEMEIMDNAVFQEGKITGIFFDITDYMKQKRELSEALEMQEFLNDQIFNTIRLLQKTQVSAIKALARLAEFRDQETGNHLQRICEYTHALASEVYRLNPYSFKISRGYQNDIYVSSMLHDIGKVGIPDSILLKPGKLTREEWDVMKKHTLWGWETLVQADREMGEQSFLTLAATIALNHHERYDGSGYPNGLRGEDIPLSARITAVADVYDALTTRRPYKEAWSHERATEELVKQRGLQFDAVLIDIYLSIEDRFHEIRTRFPD